MNESTEEITEELKKRGLGVYNLSIPFQTKPFKTIPMKQKNPQAYMDYLKKDVQKRLDADIITEKEAFKELEEAKLRIKNPKWNEPENHGLHVQPSRRNKPIDN